MPGLLMIEMIRDSQGFYQTNQCPDTDEHGKIRSLRLPNLSVLTREIAQEYFD